MESGIIHIFNVLDIYCQIPQLVIPQLMQYIWYFYQVQILRVLGHSPIKPWHFNIMQVHAGLDFLMHEWQTQSSISYELRHVSLHPQANGSACIRRPMPWPLSSLWRMKVQLQQQYDKKSECVFHENISCCICAVSCHCLSHLRTVQTAYTVSLYANTVHDHMSPVERFVRLKHTKADLSVRKMLHMNPSPHVAWHLPLGHSALHQWPVFSVTHRPHHLEWGQGMFKCNNPAHCTQLRITFNMLSWGHSNNDLKWWRLAGCVHCMGGWLICFLRTIWSCMLLCKLLWQPLWRQHAAPHSWLISKIHLRAYETKTSQCSKITDK